MHHSIRMILLGAATLVILVTASASSTMGQGRVADGSLLGDYVQGNFSTGETFTFSADGRFSYRTYSDCGPTEGKSGFAAFERDGIIRMQTKRFSSNDTEKCGDIEEKFTDFDDDFPADRPMRFVRWGPRSYVVFEDDLVDFAAAVNFGVEPRRKVYSDFFRVFIREGDEAKPVTGVPELPEPYAKLVNSRPISATIESVEIIGDETIYAIDKGASDGVRPFLAFRATPLEGFDDEYLYVLDVAQNSARLRCRPSWRSSKCNGLKYRANTSVETHPGLRWRDRLEIENRDLID